MYGYGLILSLDLFILTTAETHQTQTWESLDEIADAVQSCTKCTLHTGRTNAVPGSGSATGGILVIGEGPGFNE
ncbi:MAG: hypothetical protein H8D69_01065, partial [Chloroflexi bacterium]|nr:hypothetical protein [Chloroflexota bacterium]